MAYATQADIEAIYTEEFLVNLADFDGNEIADDTVVDRALADASGLIDSHISIRYDVPIATVPDFLRRICIDIAVYTIAVDADRLTEEYRRRYEDAIRHLERIADGRAGLGIPVGQDGADTDDQRTGQNPMIFYRTRR